MIPLRQHCTTSSIYQQNLQPRARRLTVNTKERDGFMRLHVVCDTLPKYCCLTRITL
ncbi:hypothetical protein WN48_04130 [Eufriesea mexicana]|uniref:Uncharacterized protein n=1 Tax=Eufriesea mexicana TaxID=516756 RepID=A0A310SJL8_9HYME|nr:hypothetical protein WN48_04130 [Eufriesea mexicana]